MFFILQKYVNRVTIKYKHKRKSVKIMPYKHPLTDNSENTLVWQLEPGEMFGGFFNPRHSHWFLIFQKVIDVTPSELETVTLKYKKCRIKVEKHSKRFNRKIGEWVECEPFLRVNIDVESYIPSRIDGQAIVACKENSELLQRMFWEIVKTDQVNPLSEEESAKNKLLLAM
jgi:hypothetical protein